MPETIREDEKTLILNSGNKTALITGASSGIGLAVARNLAGNGWRIIGLGRDVNRVREAKRIIGERVGQGEGVIDMVIADLSIMAEVVRAAREIESLTDKIDLLVNNAGGIPAERVGTIDGLEHTFAANHLGPFLLTRELLPLLKRSLSRPQIINVASVAHRFVKDMLWDDLQLEAKFDAGAAYAQSKLANILFTRKLASHLKDEGIYVNAVHPGLIKSNFWTRGNWFIKTMYRLSRPFSLTPEQGADTILWLSGKSNPGTGGYFHKRKLARLTAAAQSDDGAERLWRVSEKLLSNIAL